MNSLSQKQLSVLLKEQRIKPRLVRELRFHPDEVYDWSILELLAITTRSEVEGLLLIDIHGLYVVPYELTVGIIDKKTGRSKPITCDLCFTWQQGRKAGRITFRRPSDNHTFSYLCCADLKCSLHVRDITPESILSRTQLQENNDIAGRVRRLTESTAKIIETLGINPLELFEV